jgi:peptidoglycan hydrolase CwlO-like protein
MTVEISVALAIISTSAAIFFGIKSIRHNQKKEDQNEASQTATIITKLDGIEKGVDDIKEELKNVKAEVRDDHDKIIRLEESTKQAHKRLDAFEKG